MQKSIRIAMFVGSFLFAATQAHALVVCARDDGTGQPREKSKLVLKSTCAAGKEVEIGIAVTGTVGVDAKVEVYDADFDVTGGNVQVTNGAGVTNIVNGKGNVIVGYNEATFGQVRNGSHSVVIGQEHEYTNVGGLVAGYGNTVTGANATVSGGSFNTASGVNSSVSGGYVSFASGTLSSITGGSAGIASALGSSVSGGEGGAASGNYSSVTGGGNGVASGLRSSVSGGESSLASGSHSSISGGLGLSAFAAHEWHSGRIGGYPTVGQY